MCLPKVWIPPVIRRLHKTAFLSISLVFFSPSTNFQPWSSQSPSVPTQTSNSSHLIYKPCNREDDVNLVSWLDRDCSTRVTREDWKSRLRCWRRRHSVPCTSSGGRRRRVNDLQSAESAHDSPLKLIARSGADYQLRFKSPVTAAATGKRPPIKRCSISKI